MSDRPSDSPCDDAVASFEAYMQARQRYEASNVIPFRPRQMARQQVDHDLAMALARVFRSTEAAGKYDDGGDKP